MHPRERARTRLSGSESEQDRGSTRQQAIPPPPSSVSDAAVIANSTMSLGLLPELHPLLLSTRSPSLATIDALSYMRLRNEMQQHAYLSSASSIPLVGVPTLMPPPYSLSMFQPMLPQAISSTPLIRNSEVSALHGLAMATDAERAVLESTVASMPRANAGEIAEEQEEEDAALVPSAKIRRYKRETWDVMFERLLKYKEKHGDCSVPQDYRGIPKLGNWVQKQRTLKKANRLAPDREERLDAVGFTWRVQESWDYMFDCLVKYKNEHGDCNVPKHYAEDPKLGKWVKTQKMRRKILSEERLERLKSIGFE